MDYETKELSKSTFPDLEKLFRKPGIGDAWWCWCTFHHTASFTSDGPHTRAAIAKTNYGRQIEFIEHDQSHGIIVYLKGDPVGWCQYGLREELPRTDHTRAYQGKIVPELHNEKLWRITCFVVDKDQRKKGVASVALKAAVEAIEKKGGGLVEGFPVDKTDQGPGYMCTGRVSMFKELGFKEVGPFGSGRTSKVVMRRKV